MKYIKNKLLFITNHIQCLIFLSILILQTSGAFATDDKRKIRWTAEGLYSINTEEYKGSRHGYSSEYFRKRTEYFIGVEAEYLRTNKKLLPWLSPSIVLISGFFQSQLYEYSDYQYQPGRYTQLDTFEFASIPFIPQIGIQAKPFYKLKWLNLFSFNFRLGYQINSIKQYNYKKAEVKTTEDWTQMPSPWVNYQSKTTLLNSNECDFPHWYTYLGISNEFGGSGLGLRISYSWQQWAQRGWEFAISYRIH